MVLQRNYRIIQSGNLKALYKHANLVCNSEVRHAIDSSLDKVVDTAKVVAPVYDQLKWPEWMYYEHHYYPPPGSLKGSIMHTPTKAYAKGASYKANYGSKLWYAKYIEDGFYHKKTHEFIVGKHFMESSLDLVMPATFHLKMRKAAENIMTSPAIGD